MKPVVMALLLLGWVGPAWGQKNNGSDTPLYTTRVQVNTSASEKEIDKQIYSYISRELRHLSGVTIVETDPNWVISIASVHTQTVAGVSVGVALSVAIFSVHVTDKLKQAVAHRLASPAQMKKIEPAFHYWPAALLNLENQRILVGSTDDLRNLCQSLVTRFDTEQLEPMRQLYQKIEDRYKAPPR